MVGEEHYSIDLSAVVAAAAAASSSSFFLFIRVILGLILPDDEEAEIYGRS